MIKRTVVTDNGLQVPMFLGSEGKFASEPMALPHSLIQLLVPAKELETLLVMKLNKDEEDPSLLAPQTFEDGIDRTLIFSSGDNYYFGDEKLQKFLHKTQEGENGAIFETQRDAACRYGSLLVSDCYRGLENVKGLKVKIVDYTDPQFDEFRTGDCHGKISAKYAKEVGAKPNTPFQFRLAFLEQWGTGGENEPQHSFIAKGTFVTDTRATEAQGYDLVLDRSSIKGVSKELIKEWFPCGDYEIPAAVLGNRSNAQQTPYAGSWQRNMWYSPEAILKDLGEITKEKAAALADARRNPLTMAQHMVTEHDKEQERRQKQEKNQKSSDPDISDLSELQGEVKDEKSEQRIITVLRNDKHGEMLAHPKITGAMEDYDRKRWKTLAIKSGHQSSSGMALPAPTPKDGEPAKTGQLERGQACIPFLPEGDVIITRFPIINADNIRIYENVHDPILRRTRNTVWMHPKDAEEYHQADFDGDQIACDSAANLPNIAAETSRAGDSSKFITVVQRDKIPYSDDMALHEIAYAACKHRVGQVSMSIGRVYSASFNEDIIPSHQLANNQIINAAEALQINSDPEQEHNQFKLGNWTLEISAMRTVTVQNEAEELIFRGNINRNIGISLTEKGYAELGGNVDLRRQLFDLQKENLLDRLMLGLQVEVDHQKNSERLEDISTIRLSNDKVIGVYGNNLLKECNEFSDYYPAHFFTFCKDEKSELYRNYPMPADESSPLNILAEKVVNPFWEVTRLPSMDRDHFRYLFPEKPMTLIEGLDLSEAEKDELIDTMMAADEWASNLKNRHKSALKEIRERTKGDEKASKEETGKMYENFRQEFKEKFPGGVEKIIAAAALWQAEHTKPDLSSRRLECLEVAAKLPITFDKQRNYKLPSEALPQDRYVLSVPFGNGKTDKVLKWEMDLVDAGIEFEAVVNPKIPVVEFAFKDIPEKTVQALEKRFDGNISLYKSMEKIELPQKFRIIAPKAYGSLLDSAREAGSAALVFNICTEQIAQRLREKEIEPLTIKGIGRNELKGEDFSSEEWKDHVLKCTVGKIQLDPENPEYRRYNGMAIIEVEGKQLGSFGEESAKFPIGTTFEATITPKPGSKSVVFLNIQKGSIQLPQVESESADQTDEKLEQKSNATQLTERVMAEVKRKYESHDHDPKKTTTIRLGNLKASIQPDGETTVRNANRQSILKGNIHTGAIHQEISAPTEIDLRDRQPSQTKPENSKSADRNDLKESKKLVSPGGFEID